MFQLTDVPWWPALAIYGVIAAVLGIVLSWFVPGSVVRQKVYWWRPKSAFVLANIAAIIASALTHTTLAVVPISLAVSYFFSRFPNISLVTILLRLLERPSASTEPSKAELGVERMVFRGDWNIRPRFETDEEGRYVGREELLGRLSSHFTSQGGGTILISGVRGVGKTSLVDRALVDARHRLRDRYWDEVAKFLTNSFGVTHPIYFLVRRTLLKLGEWAVPGEGEAGTSTLGQKLRLGAQDYTERPGRRFWNRFNPVGKCIRHLQEASNWQLFVLKFSASDISGAMSEPGVKTIGNPRIDPEKLLRSVIRKLFMTCHSTRQDVEAEARILKWSLVDKLQRQRFFQTLEDAYNKSVSKSYTEVVSNQINDFMKQSKSVTSERKINLERVVGLLVAGGLYAAAWWVGKSYFPLEPLKPHLIGAGAAGLTAYLTWTWTTKRARETGSNRAREARFSYEYDYSLERMQRDLESLMRTLQPSSNVKFHPLRCFTRSVVVFDELDKLDEADKQLDDVITHFKNFFTLSDTVFLFLTDHTFYEHLTRETAKAQLDRHYSPQHTFFTEKIYLRKPDFSRFQEAFYGFTDSRWIATRVSNADAPADPALTEYVLNNGANDILRSLPLKTFTHLYIQRGKYNTQQKPEIEKEFKRRKQEFEQRKGREDILCLAKIWASLASADADPAELLEAKDDFTRLGGWSNEEAVSFLYHFRKDIPGEEDTIAEKYDELEKPPLTEWVSVREIEFSLSDLAHALCFQTRNHYFDLYQMVYDYVGSYADGAPILYLEGKRFSQETRLGSRYQQLLEIAFDSVKEDHPSREYFNGLVMESLYRVFDKRALGQSVTIDEILLQPSVSPTINNPPVRKKALKTEIPTYTDRDVEKVNQAIKRLLHLALEHKAISPRSANLEQMLKHESVDRKAFGNCKFVWNDDIESTIRVVERATHERLLLRFWNENAFELNALDTELLNLWNDKPMPDESTRIRRVIGELRSRAESVRLKSIKISEFEASALRANVGTLPVRNIALGTDILKRIRDENDANILADSGLLSPASDLSSLPKSQLESRMKAFKLATAIQPKAVISPYNTGAIYYFVADPVGGRTGIDLSSVLKENERLFWFTPSETDSAESVLTSGSHERINYYFPPLPPPSTRPSALALLDDYRRFASEARLERLLPNWKADSRDSNLALRIGAEVMGPIENGNPVQTVLALHPAAVNCLAEARERFTYNAPNPWSFYEVDISKKEDDISKWMERVTDELATNIASRTGFGLDYEPLNFKLVVANTLKRLVDVDSSRLNPDKWVRVFVSAASDPNAVGRLLLAEVTREIMSKRIISLGLDEKSQTAVIDAFAPWLADAIMAVGEKREASLDTLLGSSEWAVQVDEQRRALRLAPMAAIEDPKPSRFARLSKKIS